MFRLAHGHVTAAVRNTDQLARHPRRYGDDSEACADIGGQTAAGSPRIDPGGGRVTPEVRIPGVCGSV
jgi:hypothetical protein